MILAPYINGRKGEHAEIIETIRKDGFVRIRLDGEIKSLDDNFKIAKTKRHTIEAVVDRLVTGKAHGPRLTDSGELASMLGDVSWGAAFTVMDASAGAAAADVPRSSMV